MLSSNTDPALLPAHVMSDEIGAGRLSPVDIVDAALARIGAQDQKLHAFVEVYDKEFNLVAASAQITDNSWKPPQPLKRGGIYSWQVKAIKDGREFSSPRPPAPQAKFRILDLAKVNELAQARRAYASSHLTLGLLYVQAGLLDEAEQEFRALKKSNPDSALVQRLLSQVQRLRR